MGWRDVGVRVVGAVTTVGTATLVLAACAPEGAFDTVAISGAARVVPVENDQRDWYEAECDGTSPDSRVENNVLTVDANGGTNCVVRTHRSVVELDLDGSGGDTFVVELADAGDLDQVVATRVRVVSGADSDVRIADLRGGEAEIVASGTSVLDLGNVGELEALDFDLRGDAAVDASGQADRVTLDLAGNTLLEGSYLLCDEVTGTVAGNAEASVAAESADVDQQDDGTFFQVSTTVF